MKNNKKVIIIAIVISIVIATVATVLVFKGIKSNENRTMKAMVLTDTSKGETKVATQIYYKADKNSTVLVSLPAGTGFTFMSSTTEYKDNSGNAYYMISYKDTDGKGYIGYALKSDIKKVSSAEKTTKAINLYYKANQDSVLVVIPEGSDITYISRTTEYKDNSGNAYYMISYKDTDGKGYIGYALKSDLLTNNNSSSSSSSTPSTPTTPSTEPTPTPEPEQEPIPNPEPEQELVKPTSITLNKTTATIDEGSTLTLTATISPSNVTNKTITWSSNNASVATVSNGVVTAKSAGSATITARTSNGKIATANITVKKPEVLATSITLNKTTDTIDEGSTLTLTATISPSNVTNKTITWSSDNASVATVSNGVVTAKSAGSATITARTSNGKIATANITVKKPEVLATSITLKKTATIDEGTRLTLMATISPRNVTNKTITWSSNNTHVATVNNGVVTAKSVGSATITARTSNGKIATSYITVQEPKPVLVGTLIQDDENKTKYIDGSKTNKIVTRTMKVTRGGKKVDITSSSPEYIIYRQTSTGWTVDENPETYIINYTLSGSYSFIACHNSVSKYISENNHDCTKVWKYNINVDLKPTLNIDVRLNNSSGAQYNGSYVTASNVWRKFTTTGNYKGKVERLMGDGITWVEDGNQDTYLYNYTASGTQKFRVCNNFTNSLGNVECDEKSVTVNVNKDVTFDLTSITLKSRQEKVVTANAVGSVSYSSNHPEVAGVSPNGVVHAYKKGSTVITATSSTTGKKGSYTLNVVPSRMLMVGNSKTYYSGKNNTSGINKRMEVLITNEGKHDIEVVRKAEGGKTLKYHADNPGNYFNTEYDYVILQEQTDTALNKLNDYKAGALAVAKKLKGTPKIYVRQTWPVLPAESYANGNQTLNDKEAKNYKNDREKLKKNAQAVANDLSSKKYSVGSIINDGDAFVEYKDQFKNKSVSYLYFDERHQTMLGAQIAAACIYREVFGTPIPNFNDAKSLDSKLTEAQENAKIQEAVNSVCK